eukprot:m.124853 g.124853  ORF g.124853 m.124853 type:complete len:235 (+) comp17301_c0_seq1:39-743(+)
MGISTSPLRCDSPSQSDVTVFMDSLVDKPTAPNGSVGVNEASRTEPKKIELSHKNDERARKILARKERNRASALKSRLRKQEHIESLKSNICDAAARKNAVEARVRRLRQQTAELKQQVELAEGRISSQAGAIDTETSSFVDFESTDMESMLLLDRSPTNLHIEEVAESLGMMDGASLLAGDVDIQNLEQLPPLSLEANNLSDLQLPENVPGASSFDWMVEQTENPLSQHRTIQ